MPDINRHQTQVSVRSIAGWGLAIALAVTLASAAWRWSSQTDVAPPAPNAAPVHTVIAPSLAGNPAAAVFESLGFRQILAGRFGDWRVMRLAENPKILVIEFPDLASQGKAFNRLAALVEKDKAPRDRVLGDEGLARFIKQVGDTPETFFFGHDYPAEAIARFFTLSVNQQVMLNSAELRLGNILLAANLLREESDRLVANPDRHAVVSFTATQADDPSTAVDETVDAKRRETILRHEMSHGEFFTNAGYREHCWSFWQKLTDSDRGQLRKFLTAQGYDPRNEELMVNETQAFLMHTPDSRAFGADQLGISEARLAELRLMFSRKAPVSIFSSIDRQAGRAEISAPR